MKEAYPTFQDLNQIPHQLLSDSSSPVIRCKHEGREIIIKPLRKTRKEYSFDAIHPFILKQASKLKALDDKLKMFVSKQIPVGKYRNETYFDNNKLIDTIKLWTQHNIPTANILDENESRIILEYVGDYNLKQLLSQETYQPTVVDSLVTTAHLIKESAKKANNINILHPDSWPKNYIYNTTEQKTYAIDPEGPYHKNTTFDQALICMNMRLLYGLERLDTPHADIYLKTMISSLDTREKKFITQDNKPVSQIIHSYYDARIAFGNIFRKTNANNKLERYTKERVEKINDYLSSY